VNDVTTVTTGYIAQILNWTAYWSSRNKFFVVCFTALSKKKRENNLFPV